MPRAAPQRAPATRPLSRCVPTLPPTTGKSSPLPRWRRGSTFPPYYLSRLFRRVTGQSIVDYLNNRRIEAAQKLLETTELSISAIAEQTGFASAAHFRRVFREVMDISPLQYRKKQTK